MIAYVDCRRGISGTSCLAALVDAGANAGEVAERLGFLARGELSLRTEDALLGGIRTRRIRLESGDVRIAEGPGDLIELLAAGGLPVPVRDRATDVYRRLAAAEARVHGATPDTVRFHELATLRSVVGVVGTAVALEQLGVEGLTSTPIPFGRGTVDTEHGRLPVPTPATLELLRGLPVEPQQATGELITPTGAALLASAASSFGAIPPMTIELVGIGSANSKPVPIVTRVVIGRG
jgi:hypothetical protein